MLIAAQILQFAACVYIIAVSLFAINKMSRGTGHTIGWAYIALAVGALAEIESAYHATDVRQCVFVVGVALYLFCNRRSSDAPKVVTT